ncbi:uncharacterized protein LOC126905303 isoform X2 [Daktulosphaira vitifoliae]|nr:uncharacterized protein LOC126905303 isoform X2 [Daktulosphaira vitifoliae]XP_050540831.1 uncharacterized protein LOC126905303 isoform X2 [Daktulosphaira vitifoliae]
MAIKGFTLILVTFAFYNGSLGVNDCTLPWLVNNNPFYKTFDSLKNRCPPILGNPDKEYCCYNTDGTVECCDFPEFLAFGLICLLPILIILLIISCFISCICCLCCPCCTVYRRRQGGRVLAVAPPSTVNYVFVEHIPQELYNNPQYLASASIERAPLIQNEYPKSNAGFMHM